MTPSQSSQERETTALQSDARHHPQLLFRGGFTSLSPRTDETQGTADAGIMSQKKEKETAGGT